MRVALEKYWTIIRMSWINGFAYPVSFWMWRVRQVTQIIVSLSLWEAIFVSTPLLAGYDKSRMLSYVFASFVISYVVLASRTIDVGNIVHSGDLSLYLIRPLKFFKYWFVRDLADKFQNILFSVCEVSLVFLIFQPTLSFPHSFGTIILTLLAVIGGLLLYYFLNLIFGFFAFWSPDVWAPRFLFFVVMFFVSGSTFPIDIYPEPIVKVLMLTPFPYFMFFQTKIWLEQLHMNQIVQGFGILSFWAVGLYFFSLLLWKKGTKEYGAEGR
jgi:ABC-2 type transport system permease protein